eukprot:5520940-Amphidinium_carterae.1
MHRAPQTSQTFVHSIPAVKPCIDLWSSSKNYRCTKCATVSSHISHGDGCGNHGYELGMGIHAGSSVYPFSKERING